MRHALVEEVARAVAVHGGEGDGVAEAEGVELVYARVGQSGGVHLVHAEDDRLFGAEQHVGHFPVRRRHAGAYLRDEHDDVRRVYGYLRLFAHEEEYLVVRGGLDAARVHDVEFPAVPLALGVEPVARDAGGVLHYGEPPPREAVEEHGLADVRPAHYCNKRS